jgi:Ca2+-binding EF-hand superfamily protein
LLKVDGATERDMAELFEALDFDSSGLLEYSELKRAKRVAKVKKIARPAL